MMVNASYRGFTLFEWLITAAVVAVVLAMSTPAMIQFVARNRIAGAAEVLANNLKLARSESSRRGVPVYVRFQSGADWCSGLHESAECDCTVIDAYADNACTLTFSSARSMHTVTGNDYPGVELITTSFFRNTTAFDPVRGTARPGTLRLQGRRGAELRVVVSLLGRVRICAARGFGSNVRYIPC